MKIAYFHKGFWPSNSPSTTFITYNAMGFFNNNYDFTLITGRNSKESVNNILKNNFNITSDLQIKSTRCFKSSSVLKYIAFFKMFYSNYDVIITRDLSFLPLLMILKKNKRNLKIIYEAHDFYYDLSLRDDIKRSRFKKQHITEKKYLNKIDGIICVSKQLKKLYENYLPDQNIIAATTGLYTKTFSNQRVKKENDETLKLTYIGSLKHKKYPLEIIIKAISMCSHKDKIKLSIAGIKNNEEKEHLKNMIAAYSVSSNITLLDWLNAKELNQILCNTDIGVAVLSKTFLNNAASPLKILEYISYSIPIVCTDLDGVKDIITDKEHGFLIKNDPNEWRLIFDYICENQNILKQMKQNCRNLAEKLTWEKRASKIMEFLESLNK